MPQSAPKKRPLSAIVRDCLPRLNAISANLTVYGDEKVAEQLCQVVAELKAACPVLSSDDPMKFIVSGTFKVSRQQVAATFIHAFSSELDWFEVTKATEPSELRFQAIHHLQVRLVDYPLNEGGSITIVEKHDRSRPYEINLEAIAAGLDVLANHYPRHFADLINENSDPITANALLQCCVFGEIVHE